MRRLVLCQLTHFSASRSGWSIDFHGPSSLVPNFALKILDPGLLLTAEPAGDLEHNQAWARLPDKQRCHRDIPSVDH